MHPNDIMPFGKYGKGKGNLTIQQVKHDQPDYVAWLIDQEGFDKKNPELFEYFTKGVYHTKPLEKENYDAEAELLAGQPKEFKDFWFRAYGDRLRKDGAERYIGYLRVAITTWDACQSVQNFKPLPKPAMLPPPLSHIPAPNITVPRESGSSIEPDSKDDEEVNF